ncbi:MAG: uncharacterized protein JWM27_4267 [Gemmatimonadetes bacterium]|nr:uncharacterized protein [Gemmatimonadota bacterium]
MVAAASGLPLTRYTHISVHAPSQFSSDDEGGIVEQLSIFQARGWPIVLHPDTIHDFGLWRRFGASLLIENMDKRKPIGRNVEELGRIFSELPDAGLCFDIAHATQYDPTMLEAYSILAAYADHLRQVHISEVSTKSRHTRLSYGAILDFQKVAHRIPEGVPIIIESPVAAHEIADEIRRAGEALTPRAAVAV